MRKYRKTEQIKEKETIETVKREQKVALTMKLPC